MMGVLLGAITVGTLGLTAIVGGRMIEKIRRHRAYNKNNHKIWVSRGSAIRQSNKAVNKPFCIRRFRNKHGTIIGYRISVANNKQFDIQAKKLKELIRKDAIEVENLTLTSDGRLGENGDSIRGL